MCGPRAIHRVRTLTSDDTAPTAWNVFPQQPVGFGIFPPLIKGTVSVLAANGAAWECNWIHSWN